MADEDFYFEEVKEREYEASFCAGNVEKTALLTTFGGTVYHSLLHFTLI